jgi:hypothetical protein
MEEENMCRPHLMVYGDDDDDDEENKTINYF